MVTGDDLKLMGKDSWFRVCSTFEGGVLAGHYGNTEQNPKNKKLGRPGNEARCLV